MNSGFQLLKTRGVDEILDVTTIEERHQLFLPPLYKIFVETFHLGDDGIITDLYKNPSKDSDYRHCSFYSYIDKDLMFAGFNDLESAMKNYKNVEEWVENKYLPIGNTGFNATVVLSLEGEDSDSIYLHDFDEEPKFRPLCSNVFSFVRGLTLDPVNQKTLVSDVTLDKLYKKWGEDFWRVREE